MDLAEFVKQLSARTFPLTWPGHWVAGRWLLTGRTAAMKSSFNPNTGQKLIDAYVDKDAVSQAVEFAHRHRGDAAETGLAERLAILQRFRLALTDYQEPLTRVLCCEAGKPRWEAREDILSAVNYLDWVVQNGEHVFACLLAPTNLGPHRGGQHQLLPIGVTGAYLPFSTPITTFTFYFAASVLAGCPLILNSSAHALVSSLLIALLAQQQELPPYFLQVVFGNFNSFKYLIADKRVAALLYTGSREHCDTIRLESRAHVGRQMVVQSGGKNAVIVHSSADLNHAVRCVVYGALKSAGQRCTSTSRVFVYRSLLPEFRGQLTEAFRKIAIGRTDLDPAADADPAAAHTPFMGPLYSEKAVEKYLRFQTMANREAEATLLWGRSLDGLHSGGYFVSPSVHYLGRFDNTTAYQGNVLFSPDVAIYDYDVLDAAIEQINTTDAAFAVSFIGDPDVIASRRQRFLAPNLLVNTPTVETEATLPLGGRLQSGHHRFHGPGIALYLCYPQVLAGDPETEQMIRSWPWPGF